jgi:hypothetical protein
MPDTGSRSPNHATTARASMPGSIAFSARANSVSRSGQSGFSFQEAVDLAEGGAAVLVQQVAPLDELLRDRIVALVGEPARGDPVAAIAASKARTKMS